jgi:glycosyltransferase involved in cell wall biosynthesis
MHIIGLVEHPEHVCARYRLAAYAPFLERRGHHLELRAIPNGMLARMRLWKSVREADVVVLQRRLLAGWHLYLLRRHARRLIFDFDDAVYQRDSYATKPMPSTVRLRRFIRTLHAADGVIAGNPYLYNEAVRFTDPGKIHVLPTCIDPTPYPMAEHRHRGKGVHLVWIGSSSTLQGLTAQAGLWNAIARKMPGVSLKVICDRFPQFATMPVVKAPWSLSMEGRELAAADIGISWLPDDSWSRGKCGLKLLQYMAAGLPVIANPVGVQADLVRHGRTGFLVNNPTEWVAAVRQLALDPVSRRRLGKAGRRHVMRYYSTAAWAERWLQALAPRAVRMVG